MIDGDIQSRKESSYLQEVDKSKTKRFKLLSISFGIGLILLTAIAGWQFVTIKKLSNSSTALIDEETSKINEFKIDSLLFVVDSINHLNAKLKLSNDLLLERFDGDQGIYFEIHMEFSGDFDLDQYNKELSNLVSQEFDEREKLVLARFRSFKKALLFENDLKKMGIKGLFLLGRVDGKIMTFKEALAIAQNQNK